MFFVGIDVSKDKLDFYLNKKVKGIVSNDVDGYTKLYEIFKEYEDIAFILESTGIYSKNLFMFLKSRNLENLYYISAKDVALFRKIMNWPKTDKIDAKLIQSAGSKFSEKLTPFVIPEDKILALRPLTRDRYYLSHQLAKEKTRLLSMLADYFPGLSKELNLSNTLMTILSDYDADEITNMSINDLFKIVSDISKKQLSIDFAKKLKSIVSKSYSNKLADYNTANIMIKLSSERIVLLKKQIALIDKKLKSFLNMINQTLTTIKGIGPILAASIISEIGNINNFKTDSKLSSFAGLRWDKRESGKYIDENPSLSKKGNKYLRYYLYQAASSVKMYEPVFKEYYRSKIREGKVHKAAVILTARKLIRSIFIMLKDNVPYKPNELKDIKFQTTFDKS